MEEESIAKLLQIPRNLFINYRDPTLIKCGLDVKIMWLESTPHSM